MGLEGVYKGSSVYECTNGLAVQLALPAILTALLVLPIDEDVHGPHFCDRVLVSIEPQHLLAALLQSFILNIDRGAVISTRQGSERRIRSDFTQNNL